MNNQDRQKALEQQMKQEVEQVQAATKYPSGLVPSWFAEALKRALRHESSSALGCTWPELKSIREGHPMTFSLSQMGHALNCLESKTPVQLGVDDATYNEWMEAQEQMAKKWNEMVMPLRQEIMKKYSNKKTIVLAKRN